MKTESFILKIIIVAIFFNSCDTNNSNKRELSISISGAYALYPLAQKWVQEYNKTHTNVKFDIQSGGAGKGMVDVLAGAVEVGMFSRDITAEEKSKGIWWIDVCKEAVVPVVNSQNPYMEILR